MSYLDDLKKKGQTLLHNVQSAANTAKNVYNAAQQGVQNVYNAATGTTPKTQQAPNTQPSAAVQQQQEQANRDHAAKMNQMQQNQVDWAAEYDKAMAPQTTPTTSAQPGGQVAQPPTSAAAQSALGEGAGQWQAELDNVMAQIMGKGKFDYNMNGDAMYQQYADIYQNQANLGMQNAMAQAAALTGGYGSSYGQMVGQQAYAQQMQGLNDIGLELYDRAYAQDMAERSQLMDQYNMLAAREEQAYNRAYQEGRDKVADDQWDKTHNWQLEQFDKLYGDEGFYATESQKDRDQQTKLQDDSQAHDITLQTNDQTHDKNMATQEHDWQVEEWDKMYGDLVYDDEGNIIGGGYQTKKDHQDQENWKTENEQDQKQFDSLYGYTDENGVFHEGYYDRTREDEQAYQQGIHNDLYGYTDENGEYHEGYYEKEANKDREQDQNQFNAMYGYTDESGVYHEGYNDRAREDEQKFQQDIHDDLYGYTDEKGNKVSGYYEDMADKEFNQMYGDLEYDKDGNIIGGGYYTKKDAQDQKNWQDAQGASKTTTKYEGEGALSGQNVPIQLANVPGLTTTNTKFFDENGYFKQAAVVSSNAENGTTTYTIDGKTTTVKSGTNPYTNTINPDAKNGTFDNGYQPTHIGGEELQIGKGTKLSDGSVAPEYDVINGTKQTIYKTSDGQCWIWDDTENEYIKYGEPYKEKKDEKPTNSSGTTSGTGLFRPTQVIK